MTTAMAATSSTISSPLCVPTGCPSYQEDAEIEQRIDGRFSIKRNDSGGFSAFADRFLPRHTVVVIELPLLYGGNIDAAARLHNNGTHCSQADDDAFLRDNVGLDDSRRRRIWALHDQYVGNERINPNNNEKRLLGIVKTNAYLSTDTGGLGLYPTISRFNHSCTPNVGYGFDNWSMRLYTTCDIQPGQELTTCYSDMVYFHNRHNRQAYLKSNFNFECHCQSCRLIEHQCEDDIRISDERRSRLKFISQMLYIRDDGIVKHANLQILLESIHLLREESLGHNLASTYRLAFEWARQLENVGIDTSEDTKGLDLGSECLRIFELSKGENHPETKVFRARLSSDRKAFR